MVAGNMISGVGLGNPYTLNSGNINGGMKFRCNTTKTFRIPLMSTIIGHLIPADQHRMLPGRWFG